MTAKRITLTVMAIILAIVSVMTTLAFVIAKECTGIPEKAGIFKLINLAIFPPAFYFLAWRRNSLPAALLLPLIQFLAVCAGISYLNSLPMTCP